MPAKEPLKPISVNSKKRKSTGSNGPSASRPTKQPRRTLDAFFAPRVDASIRKDEGGERKSVALNLEQNSVLRMVVDEGKNVFFTGSAGTGKSLLLRSMITALKKKYAKTPDAVSVTASTGMAASNIGGMTIHAWGAIAPTVQDIDKLISYIKKCKPAYQRWRTTKVLIIDEISMVVGHLFDILATLASKLRKKTDRPFGGIQLIVTGDFFQLPPVSKGNPFFAFESDAWKSTIERTVNLSLVYRQQDSKFVDLLNDLRRGKISPEGVDTFKSLSRPLTFIDGILPTELFPLRQEVDKANTSRLGRIKSRIQPFLARDSGSEKDKDKREKLLKSMPVGEKVYLKLEAQVMLVKNVDERLVNGSVGKVLGFYTLGSVESEPLPQPASLTTAKQTSNSNSISGKPASGTNSKPPSSLSPSQGQSSNGHVRNVRMNPERNRPVVTDAKEKGAKGKGKERDEEQYPLVEFVTPQGKEAVLLIRDEFRVEDNEGNLLARRMQIPLVLAWAMSIHKSQGQTIQRVKIDLGRVFEKGQSYVALSRAASLEGLQVLNFNPKKVMAHPKVIEWSKQLEEGCSDPSTPS